MKRRSKIRILLLFALCGTVGLAMLATGRVPSWRRWLRVESPHEQYARALREGGLAQTALATEWLAAAARALEHPIALGLPFTEAALVDPVRPLALGYEVTLKRGQRLDVQITVATDTPGRVFIDLFQRDSERTAPLLASALETETTLSHEASDTGVYVLRIQPELLRGGHVTVRSTAAASLLFPVRDVIGIQSAFGDPRDGGRRRHEGVDIFAKAGTPVRAVSGGLVSRVGENTLGGRVVWLWDVSRGLRYYYAHLQEQRVRPGTFVSAGDVLGTVGNTGNARTTAPHLHFGVYAAGSGAIDPDGFIRSPRATTEDPALSTDALGGWGRTRETTAVLAAPSPDAAIVATLAPGTELRVEGALGAWIRTRTGSHRAAFVSARQIVLGPDTRR